MTQAQDGKDRWDERYREPGFAYGTEANEFLQSVVTRLPPGRVLSLAEGEGRNAVYLGKRGFQLTAVDQSAVGLAKASGLARMHGVDLSTEVADLKGYRIEPSSWEVVVSIFCHVPPSIRKRLYRAVVEGLVPGGALVLEAYTPQQLELGTGGPKDRDLLVDLSTLCRELSGLTFEIARETVREIHEGRYHDGAGAVVQVLAFR